MKKLLIAAICCASFAANAAKDDPFVDYYAHARTWVAKCKSARLTALMSRLTTDGKFEQRKFEYHECLSQLEQDLKGEMKGIEKLVHKKPKAVAALKEHFVKFSSAMKGIDQHYDESDATYERRQAMLADSMEEAWTRFELER